LGEATFAGTRANGRDAPIPANSNLRRSTGQIDPFETFMPRQRLVVLPKKRSFASGLLVVLADQLTTVRRSGLLPLEVGHIETFGEPAVDRCQELVRFGPPVLVEAQSGEAQSGEAQYAR
jgi:hypothetical protein